MTNSVLAPSRGGLSTAAATSLYVGALLGPSLLLLPGLAVTIAGPASVLSWAGLLVLSGALAMIFLALARRMPGTDGIVGYVRAGLGERAAKVVRWWFIAGVVSGAPVVCLIGAVYLAELVGADRGTMVLIAGGLLLVVALINVAGRTIGASAQLGLVAVLLVVVVVAVVTAAPHGSAGNWSPFLPHGPLSIGTAAAPLMLCFVGWEAISPMIARLRDAQRQLRRVFGLAFTITSVLYLTVAVVTVAVLGTTPGEAPIAGLLEAGLGKVGLVLAAVVAVALTLAATNAYLSGAAELIARGRAETGGVAKPSSRLLLPAVIVAGGAGLLAAVGAGWISTAALVNIPTAMFIAVYLACTIAAARVLTGPIQLTARIATVVVAAVLVFVGWPLALVALVAVVAFSSRRPAVAGRRSPGR